MRNCHQHPTENRKHRISRSSWLYACWLKRCSHGEPINNLSSRWITTIRFEFRRRSIFLLVAPFSHYFHMVEDPPYYSELWGFLGPSDHIHMLVVSPPWMSVSRWSTVHMSRSVCIPAGCLGAGLECRVSSV